MGEMVRGTLEGALLVVVWLALYTTVVGPAVGAVVPGLDEPMRLHDSDCVGVCREFPATARGWLGLVSAAVVVLAYVVGMRWLASSGEGADGPPRRGNA